MTVEEIYDHSIKLLPPTDRLRLATLILSRMEPERMVDYSDEWSEEDYTDFSRAGWELINTRMEAEENANPR